MEITTNVVLNDDNTDSYVNQTMLTCIGNKRKLVSNIRDIANSVGERLGKNKLNIVDGFAGSIVVSRELTNISNNIYVNDMEYYSYLMAQCYLITPTKKQQLEIEHHINIMNNISTNSIDLKEGIICKLYAPKDSNDIKENERCFYTRENALIIDTLREYIDNIEDEEIKKYLLVPLLNKCSINVNTAGVFKGFYKKGNIGCFGGNKECALSRIKGRILLDMPLWNTQHDFTPHCFNEDINSLIDRLPDDIDLIYLDPPYNQHPYGSNYFMLNVIANNEEPLEISKVSGIPKEWNKSNYNTKQKGINSMKDLLHKGSLKSKYILLSYNNEGIIKKEDWEIIFEPYNVEKYEIVYNTYKGSRNLKNRSNKVIEIMYLISKK